MIIGCGVRAESWPTAPDLLGENAPRSPLQSRGADVAVRVARVAAQMWAVAVKAERGEGVCVWGGGGGGGGGGTAEQGCS